MNKYIFILLMLLMFTSPAWGQASLEVEVYPEKFVKSGDNFYVNFQLKNTGDDMAYNVTATFDLDSHISQVVKGSGPKAINIAAGGFANESHLFNVSGSTADGTLMESTFHFNYEDIGGTPYAQVDVIVTNRAFDDVETLVTPGLATGDLVEHYSLSPDGTKLLYDIRTSHGYTSGNGDIWMINLDGTGKTQLTNDTGCESDPVFSPDGTKFAYKTNINMGSVPDATYDPSDDRNSDIYVMDLATKANTRLTTDGDCQMSPIWSPDGTKILFRDDHYTKDGDNEYSRLWIMDADGSNQLEISGAYGGNKAVWSLDGEWIYFQEAGYYTNPNQKTNVWKVRPDGTDLTQITTTSDKCESHPKISPDGTKILFKYRYEDTTKATDNEQLAVMDEDGTNLKILVSNDVDVDNAPHQGEWSPDGRWILFGWETLQGYPDWSTASTWIIDSRGMYKVNLSSGHDERKWTWAPDGSFFIIMDDDNEHDRTPDINDLYLFPLDTADGDEDNLANWEEDVIGTNPDTSDTDGDSAGDGREFDQGSNPLVADCPGVATLTATAGDGQVDLSWEAPAKSGAVASYTLYRSENAGGPYDELEANIAGTTHTDTTVTNDTTYYYVVVAVDADDFMGGDSNEAEATPQAETDDDDTGDDDTTDDDATDDDATDDDTAPSAGGDDDDDDDGCCGC